MRIDCLLLIATIANCAAVPLRADDESQRIALIESLSAVEKEDLKQKQRRFEALSADEKSRLRTLSQQIESHPQANELAEVMKRYHDWLKTLSPSQLSDLRQLPEEQRLQEVQRLVSEQNNKNQWQSFLKTARQASPQDLETVFNWLKEFVTARRDDILKSLPGDFRRRLADMSDRERQTLLLMHLVLSQPSGLRVPRPGKDEVEKLVPQLTSDMQKVFNETPDVRRRIELVSIWSWGALWSKAFPSVSSGQLADYFTKLPPEERDQLEKLPAKEREVELKNRYARANFFRSGEWGDRPWDRRDRRGDSRRRNND